MASIGNWAYVLKSKLGVAAAVLQRSKTKWVRRNSRRACGRKRTSCTWLSTCPLASLRALRDLRCWRGNGATWRAAGNV